MTNSNQSRTFSPKNDVLIKKKCSRSQVKTVGQAFFTLARPATEDMDISKDIYRDALTHLIKGKGIRKLEKIKDVVVFFYKRNDRLLFCLIEER